MQAAKPDDLLEPRHEALPGSRCATSVEAAASPPLALAAAASPPPASTGMFPTRTPVKNTVDSLAAATTAAALARIPALVAASSLAAAFAPVVSLRLDQATSAAAKAVVEPREVPLSSCCVFGFAAARCTRLACVCVCVCYSSRHGRCLCVGAAHGRGIVGGEWTTPAGTCVTCCLVWRV